MNNTRLFVSNVSLDTTPKDIRSIFSRYGKINDVYIPNDKLTGKPRGIAFVEMNTLDEANAVKNAENIKVNGNNLSISFAKERVENDNNSTKTSFSRERAPRSNFSRNTGRSGNRFGRKDPKIDFSLFVNKVTEEISEEKYIPDNQFEDFNIDKRIKDNIKNLGYITPTPIQDKTISLALEGKDVIGIANTGTGKTAAFLLPLLTKILKNKTSKVLIIAPTRELASQIRDELILFSRNLGVFSTLCIGGANINNQIMQLRRNPSFIIGTPGRLLDLAKTKKIHLFDFDSIVLDEVDRMLDMGFIEDIKMILSKLPSRRQSLFFSATMPSNVKTLANSFLIDPITISVKTRETASSINQDVVRVNKATKIDSLHDLLIGETFKKVLIFGKTKHGVEKLSNELAKRGFKAISIHGDKSQAKRQKALQLFKENVINILVATDVAARGLDIPNVTHVINYDIPQTYEDYIHRIGRTGRANQKGSALTLIESNY